MTVAGKQYVILDAFNNFHNIISYFISETIQKICFFSVPPEKVELKIGENVNPQQYAVKMQSEKSDQLSVDCVAEQARPAPEFVWYLGEEKLNVSFKNSFCNMQCYLFLLSQYMIGIELIHVNHSIFRRAKKPKQTRAMMEKQITLKRYSTIRTLGITERNLGVRLTIRRIRKLKSSQRKMKSMYFYKYLVSIK